MTKKEFFNDIINLANEKGRKDIVEFAEKEISLINKRASNDTKAKKAKAEENAKIATNVLEVLENAEAGVNTTDIASAIGVSSQKATVVLKGLVTEGKIQVEKVKGRNMYSLIA